MWFKIQGSLMPWLEEKLGELTEKHRLIVTVLEVIRIEEHIQKGYLSCPGRPPADRHALARSFVAKAALNSPTTVMLIDRVQSDPILRRICGWETRGEIPDESTFSRAFAEFAKSHLPERVHAALVTRSADDPLVGHISRDSTEIEAREKPKCKEAVKDCPKQIAKVLPGKPTLPGLEKGTVSPVSEQTVVTKTPDQAVVIEQPKSTTVVVEQPKSDQAVVVEQPKSNPEVVVEQPKSNPEVVVEQPKRKRGRPRKEDSVLKELSRLKQQGNMTLDEMLNDLPKVCDIGTKINSKGHKESWIGYKLHIDTADGGIPISCILTSASLHDSQVAIPLASLTEQRVTHLYELMDSAYDAKEIKEFILEHGHVPIIDINTRNNTKLRYDLVEEAKAHKTINMKFPEEVRYNERTTAERANSRLKDEFGGRVVRVRGAAKVMCHLMFGVLVLVADQMMKMVT